jgi:hypothetical protein
MRKSLMLSGAIFALALVAGTATPALASSSPASTNHASGYTLTPSAPQGTATTAHTTGAGKNHILAAGDIQIPAAGLIQCSGDVCLQTLSCGTYCTIHVWANTYGFRGHFELQYGCSIAGCTTQNSINTYWHAGGRGVDFGGVFDGLTGHAIAWEGGPPWKNIGHVGFTLGSI